MNVYLIAHMPRQPHGGRLAQKSRGMCAQKRVSAKTAEGAVRLFESRYPDRQASAVGQEGVEL